MPDTFVKIATVTVGSGGASSIDFTSIPSTYTDLVVKLSARTNRASFPEDYAKIEFNGVTTNLSSRILFGFGASQGSTNDGTMIYGAVNATTSTANTFGNADYYIPNYAGSSNKSVSIDSVSENNATTAVVYLVAGLWANTSAITSIKLTSYYAANFVQYTTATLYGISKS